MNGRKLTAAQQARVAEQREERVKGLQEQLQHGVAALMTSDGWQAWLSVVTRFHQYSVRDQILIMAQKPEATQVAGYRAWQAAGPQVRRGEKAISVLGPLTRKLTDHDGNLVLDDAGNPRLVIFGFKPMPVFDITQTDGPALPQSPHQEIALLQGLAPEGMWDHLVKYIESHGFTVATTSDLGVDATSEGLQAVVDGRMTATIGQGTTEQGRLAADAAADLIEGKDVEPETIVENEVFTQENAQAALDAIKGAS